MHVVRGGVSCLLFIFTRFFPPSLAAQVINLNTAGGDFDPKQESLVEVLIYFGKVTMALITPPQV